MVLCMCCATVNWLSFAHLEFFVLNLCFSLNTIRSLCIDTMCWLMTFQVLVDSWKRAMFDQIARIFEVVTSPPYSTSGRGSWMIFLPSFLFGFSSMGGWHCLWCGEGLAASLSPLVACLHGSSCRPMVPQMLDMLALLKYSSI